MENILSFFSKEVYESCRHSPLPMAVYYTTDNGYKTYILSDGYCKIYEDSVDNLKKRLDSDDPFSNIPEKKQLLETVEKFIVEEAPFNVVFHEYVGKANRLITVHARGEHLFSINGTKFAVVSYDEVSDAARRLLFKDEQLATKRELLDALDRAEAACRAKSSFLFNMSHDIRTPLNAIIGFTQLAENHKEIDIRNRYLCKVKMASEQLLGILNNVLEMARIENQQVTADVELADGFSVGKGAVDIIREAARKKNITMKSSLEIDHRWIYMDVTHTNEIFLNLATNAIKYTPEGGIVSMITRELPSDNKESCIIETVVEDNGIGMSEEFQKHAFDIFARERNTTESHVEGTGLGLAITKRLIDMLGGTIEIQSKVGTGTRITVRLPHRIGKAPSENTANTDYPTEFRGKHLLLVEDNDLNAEIASELLSVAGFIVDRAEDGIVCIDKILKSPKDTYNMVLMDIQMPKMDGYTCAKRIRALPDPEKANIPIIAVTANSFKEDEEKAIAAGMNGHISKPIQINKLMEMMEKISVLLV